MKNLSLATVFLFLFSVCAMPVLAADTFDLVIPLPLTGKPAKFGEIMKRSYEMAAEEINAKGGVKGKKIALSFEDSNGKPETARAIVEKLIDSKKQPSSWVSTPRRARRPWPPLLRSARHPTSSLQAPTTTSPEELQVCVPPEQVNAHYGDAVVSFLKEVVKPKSIAILFESSAFGTRAPMPWRRTPQRSEPRSC